jgi:hypothetical protein
MKRYKRILDESSFIKLDFNSVLEVINKGFINKKAYIVFNTPNISFGGTFQYKKAQNGLLFGESLDIAKITIRISELKEVLISSRETDDTLVLRLNNKTQDSFVIFDLNLKNELGEII